MGILSPLLRKGAKELLGEGVEQTAKRWGSEILEKIYGDIPNRALRESLEFKLNDTFSRQTLQEFTGLLNEKGGPELVSPALDDFFRHDDYTKIWELNTSIGLMNHGRVAQGLDEIKWNTTGQSVDISHPTIVDRFKTDMDNATAKQLRTYHAKTLDGYGTGTGSTRTRGDYKSLSDYFKGRGKAVDEDSFSITNVHHVYGLNDSMSLIKKHYSWVDWHDGANPIVQRIRKNGWNFGNHEKNLVDVTEVNTNALRQAEINAAEDQLTELGVYVHRETLNDAFGTSKLNPKDFDAKILNEYRTLKRTAAEDGHDLTFEDFTADRGYGEGSYPDIKVRDENKKVLETLKFETEGEWVNRFKAVFEAYQRNADQLKGTYNYAAALKDFKLLKNRKLESFAATKTSYGPDHTTIHHIIDNELKADPSTAIGKVQELSNNQAKLNKYSTDELGDLLVEAGKEAELVTYNVIKRRYNLILDVYERYRTKNAPDFEQLSKLDQQAFFEVNIAEISREGGVIGDVMTKAEALKPMDNPIPAGLQNIFNFQPQNTSILTRHSQGILASGTSDQAVANVLAGLQKSDNLSGMGQPSRPTGNTNISDRN